MASSTDNASSPDETSTSRGRNMSAFVRKFSVAFKRTKSGTSASTSNDGPEQHDDRDQSTTNMTADSASLSPGPAYIATSDAIPAQPSMPVPINQPLPSSHPRTRTSVSSTGTWDSLLTIDRHEVHEERRRALFTRYGVAFEPPARLAVPASETPDTLQRVQKRPRMRMQVTCHECKSVFGGSSKCRHCGHARCRMCAREPVKRVKEIIEQAKVAIKALDAVEEEQKVKADEQHVMDLTTGDAAVQGSHATGPSRLPPLLEPDTDDNSLSAPDSLLSRYVASANAVQYRLPQEHALGHAASEASPRTFAGVQRVYRKPMQRVRYTCNQCNCFLGRSERVCPHCKVPGSLFASEGRSSDATGSGGSRGGDAQAPFDPALLQRVQAHVDEVINRHRQQGSSAALLPA